MSNTLLINHHLQHAVIEGTNAGLSMTGVDPTPIGVTRLHSGVRDLSVMVGVVGRSSGNVMLNGTERGVRYLVSRFLDEPIDSLDDDALDAFMELGNMVAGCIKTVLDDTPWHIDAISLPSVVFGSSYAVYYSRGIESVTVEFEVVDVPLHHYRDRFFTTSISLVRGAGT